MNSVKTQDAHEKHEPMHADGSKSSNAMHESELKVKQVCNVQLVLLYCTVNHCKW